MIARTRTAALAATVALTAGTAVVVAQTGAGAASRSTAPHAVTVAEGGQATVTVRLKHPAKKKTTLVWRTRNGTAKGGLDYTALKHGEVVFHRGYRTASLQVPTLEDATPESREHLFVVFPHKADARRLTHARFKIVIADDDDGAAASASPLATAPVDTSTHVTPAPPPSK